MAITHLILVGSLKFQHIWFQGENLHWFLPKKTWQVTIWQKSIIKSFFEETKFSTKQTFLRKKLFNEVNFSKKQTFRQNKLFVNETNFSSKQLFRCIKLFNKTNILTKHTFWWNKLFYETNFEIKQTLLLIYYSDYWNLKFVIDSFFVSFKNFLFPSVQQGMIVISVENVKVNKCFTIIH